MYQALLTRKYLTRKIMPPVASVAVMLCTAIIIVTWSVMGGFLNNLLSSGRTLIGDATIVWPNVGFAHYEDLIERLEAHPNLEAACPYIETYGVLQLPDDRTETVRLLGIEGESFARVTTYRDTLYWKPMDEPLPKDEGGLDWRLANRDRWAQARAEGLSLTITDAQQRERPAMVLGMEVSGFNIREPAGFYTPGAPIVNTPDGETTTKQLFILNAEVVLHVLPLDSSGRGIEMVTGVYPVANEFVSGLFDVDKQTCFLRLDALQAMLSMDEASRVQPSPDPFALEPDPDTGELRPVGPTVTTTDPARVSGVFVRAADERMDPEAVKSACREVYDEFAAAYAGEVPASGVIRIRSWEDLNRTVIEAVRKETGLVLMIFAIASMSAVFLILAIFWAMVAEKTKDIGILRSMGASRLGVAWLWLRFGLVIGFVGAAMGVVAAWLFVENINAIHDWIGETTGVYAWDPSVYYFTEIPSAVNPKHAAIVAASAIAASVVGALVPAIRAARMDPVRALRFE